MSLESKIYSVLSGATALTALTTDHIYPQNIPQGITTPAVVYTRIGGIRVYDLQRYSTLENPTISIEIYTSSIDERRAIGDEIITAMENALQFKALAITAPYDDYNDDIKTYRRVIDFSVWHKG